MEHYLINVAGGVVEDAQHRDDSVAHSIGTANIRVRCADIVNGEADTSADKELDKLEANLTRHTMSLPGIFGNHGALLKCIINSINGVFFHRQQEARGQLGAGGACVE